MFTTCRNVFALPCRISFLFVISLFLPARTFAADFFWANPAGGSFDLPGNWSPSGPPTPGSNTVFNLGSSGYAVGSGIHSATTNIQINNDTLIGLYDATTLSVGNAPLSQGTVSINGTDLDVNVEASSAAGGLTVGVDGSGTLAESSSGQVNVVGHLVVAQNADSQGAITVDGSRLGTPGFGNPLGMTSATIGLGGTGSLAATNNSVVNLAGPFVVGQNAGSHGTVTVDKSTLGTPGFGGPEMTSATIGGAGTGSLSLTNGSRVNLVGPFTVGQVAGSQGTVTVDGAHSVLGLPGFGSGPFGPTAIGASGNGSVSITNGGTFYVAGDFTIGEAAKSQGSISVSGAGSELIAPGFGSETTTSFTLGARGNGSLSITDGGQGDLPVNVVLGQKAGSQGSLDVDGTGSKFHASGVIVGGTSASTGGAGIVNVTSGGQLASPTTVNALGQVNVAGGSSLSSGVTNSGTFTDNGSVTGIFVDASGGLLKGNGSIGGMLTLQSGSTIEPGDAPGKLTVGSFSLGTSSVASSSTFQFEIDSAKGTAGGPAGWNLLASQGNAFFHGTMTLDLVSLTQTDGAGKVFDFDPTQNYHWTFLTASGIENFNPGNFVINTAGFANPIYGTFNVSEVGESLVLNYKAPEPSSLILAVLGSVALLLCRWRRA